MSESEISQLDLWFRAFSLPRLGANVLGSNLTNGGIFKVFHSNEVEFLLVLDSAHD